MDTLASALSMVGEHAKAIELQKKAIDLNAEATVYKLHLARMYLAAGDKAKARAEIDGVLAVGDRFQGYEEAGCIEGWPVSRRHDRSRSMLCTVSCARVRLHAGGRAWPRPCR